MKTLIIYASQTGFTRKYASWIAEKTDGELLAYEDAKQKTDAFFTDYDAIVYGGWTMAGKIIGSDWFLSQAEKWHGKRLVLFFVGASPRENPDIDTLIGTMLSDKTAEHIKIFYCPGGIDYSRMKLSYRLAMKAFTAVLKKSKDAAKQQQGAYIARSFDSTDPMYIQPLLAYLNETA